ncbi:type IX secretion system motor protein PorM/GldM [Daejeonella lutea]|uniref:Gliding motility-associated protein GldM n=1 Tax=Daejeonella lutea TaxID=572036 RepID=A0A1T5CZB7_9SPHI|nr:gliding motility protein GldM [Daejeonella lutea]SKB64822.1 gliding motility-associated protein GldM [Daejeonella lutea]
MAGGKETPRQKMIGILYLVLLGLVALNVSDSILEAFKNLTDSLNTSTQNVQSGVEATYASFEATKLKEEPARAKPIYDKAKQASGYLNELNTYVDDLQKLFLKEGGGINEATGDISARDNLDISPRLMINQGRAAVLKKKINDTRTKLLGLLDEKERQGINFSLQAVDPPDRAGVNRSWEQSNFGDGIPLTAAITALAKIKADTKNAESEIVKRILGKMDQAVVNLDQFSAVAVAPTSYLIQGQPYTAEVFLTASDSKSSPDITVGGSRLAIKDGKGTYTVNTSKEGIFSWSGVVRVKQTDGSIKTYTTPIQKYQVARPSAVVSPDKMNVFYIGVPNPVSVSAPGIPKESLAVSMTGGSISGSAGKYTVTVNSPGSATVNVSANIGGKTQNVGSTQFRVKRIPDPIAKFAGKTGGALSSVVIKSQNSIFAILENFDFDAKFRVTRFSMVIAKPRADAVVLQANGGSFSSQMQAAVAAVTPGTRVIFDDIVAVGPDGTQRAIPGMVFKAN